MKIQTKFAAVSAFTVVLSGTFLFAQPSPGPRGPRAGRPEMQAHRQQILDTYDVNKDGQLDESERATLHADIAAGKVQPPAGRGRRGPGGPGPELVKQYDANGDGVLDETERATLHADIAAGKVQPPGGGGRRGPGGPSPELVKQYDANGDGVLDETERATLHADIEAGKVERPAGRGPRGPGGPGGRGPNPELVKQYDANGDGVLDETERAALRADVQSGKIERPMPKRERRGPGRRPFGGNPDAEAPATPPQE
ncbi:MAG: hypothetical protein HYY24_29485 [Verrucomicrobia bacterium]|nr:hypothetical protein [Verrucomicrobiota bacterium]